jgi:hypothetical protein
MAYPGEPPGGNIPEDEGETVDPENLQRQAHGLQAQGASAGRATRSEESQHGQQEHEGAAETDRAPEAGADRPLPEASRAKGLPEGSYRS